jgi:hypothetical protein
MLSSDSYFSSVGDMVPKTQPEPLLVDFQATDHFIPVAVATIHQLGLG